MSIEKEKTVKELLDDIIQTAKELQALQKSSPNEFGKREANVLSNVDSKLYEVKLEISVTSKTKKVMAKKYEDEF
jgi:hypothetical protein